MPTPKQLDRWSTIIGVIFVLMAIIMVWLPLFVELKKDLLEMWWWPLGTCLIGFGAIFTKEAFFKAVGGFFKRKSETL